MTGMHGLPTLARLDAQLAVRHKLLHVTVGVALVFGALLAFAAPDQLELGTTAIVGQLGELPSTGPAPTLLEPGASKPPFGQQLLTVLYTVDLCLLGFLFGSVMILQDKQQATIRYFRVSPGSPLAYMAAKLGVNLALSLLNFAILTAFVAPRALANLGLLVLVMLISAGMTALGMGLSVFLRSVSQWLFPAIALSTLLTLPTYLLLAPNPALDWTWWLPTYHMLFGSDALLFGRELEVGQVALVYAAAFATASIAACALAIHHRLMQELH
jgi:hypothetical protein